VYVRWSAKGEKIITHIYIDAHIHIHTHTYPSNTGHTKTTAAAHAAPKRNAGIPGSHRIYSAPHQYTHHHGTTKQANKKSFVPFASAAAF
jgi:hypothetical protein